MTWFLLATTVGFGILAEFFRQQRNDLASWIYYLNPEQFDEASDESSDRDDDLIGG